MVYRMSFIRGERACSMGKNYGWIEMKIVPQMLLFYPILKAEAISGYLGQNSAYDRAILRTVWLNKGTSIVTFEASFDPRMVRFSAQDRAFNRDFLDLRPVLD